MSKSIVEICASLVAAQASQTSLSPDELAESMQRIYQTLSELHQREQQLTAEKDYTQEPMASIQHNQVICLECGKAFQLLSTRHLALHGLTHRTYKEKYGIRMTQSLSARALSARRRRLAKELGIDKSLASWRQTRRRRA